MRTARRLPPELAALVLAGAAWAVVIPTTAAGPLASSGVPTLVAGGAVIAGPLLAWLAWIVMVAAMMVPATLPAARHVAENSFRWRRHRAVVTFLVGYLSVWAAVGVVALGLTVALRSWQGTAGGLARTVDAPLLGALAATVVWQMTPRRRALVRACQKSIPLAPYGWAATRSCLDFGGRLALRCVGTCWALMLVMATASTSPRWWMVAITAAVVGERFVRGVRRRPQLLAGVWLSAAVAVAFAAPPDAATARMAYFCSIPLG